ncbi:MAG: stage V sporulation protein SpoVM [Clostridia bacterium]|nr:stage V sporulation protein SpoVM [Clostridia bacterium]
MLGGWVMKVVLLKSPKLLGGFLRLIFKVKKENRE